VCAVDKGHGNVGWRSPGEALEGDGNRLGRNGHAGEVHVGGNANDAVAVGHDGSINSIDGGGSTTVDGGRATTGSRDRDGGRRKAVQQLYRPVTSLGDLVDGLQAELAVERSGVEALLLENVTEGPERKGRNVVAVLEREVVVDDERGGVLVILTSAVENAKTAVHLSHYKRLAVGPSNRSRGVDSLEEGITIRLADDRVSGVQVGGDSIHGDLLRSHVGQKLGNPKKLSGSRAANLEVRADRLDSRRCDIVELEVGGLVACIKSEGRAKSDVVKAGQLLQSFHWRSLANAPQSGPQQPSITS
jgi:hypothetical protein